MFWRPKRATTVQGIEINDHFGEGLQAYRSTVLAAPTDLPLAAAKEIHTGRQFECLVGHSTCSFTDGPTAPGRLILLPHVHLRRAGTVVEELPARWEPFWVWHLWQS